MIRASLLQGLAATQPTAQHSSSVSTLEQRYREVKLNWSPNSSMMGEYSINNPVTAGSYIGTRAFDIVSSISKEGIDFDRSFTEALNRGLVSAAELLELLELVQRLKIDYKAERVLITFDRYYKVAVEVDLYGDAREVMERWIEAIDNLYPRYRIPLFFYWAGKLDIAPSELGRYIATALTKMNLKLATEEPIDIAKLVEEMRG